MVTLTPGINAPVPSPTVPLTVALPTWPNSVAGRARRTNSPAATKSFFIWIPHLETFGFVETRVVLRKSGWIIGSGSLEVKQFDSNRSRKLHRLVREIGRAS